MTTALKKSIFLSDDDVTKLITLPCDYLRFTIPEAHGISRSKVVPKKCIADYVETGIAAGNISTLASPRCNVIPMALLDLSEERFENVFAVPVVDTFRLLPWAGNGEHKVGQVLCDMFKAKGDELPTPRSVAKAQLGRLTSMGLDLMIGLEFEFQLFHAETMEPVYKGTDIFADLLFLQNEGILYKIEKALSDIGIQVQAMHAEYGDGQFEFVTKPEFGIKALDNFFRFKLAVKEVCQQEGYIASFMSKPFPGICTNGTHFNHSLWKDGVNIFSGENDTKKMSEFMKQWTAGLLSHAKAMASLCCPSVNCYRRMHDMALPTLCNWGIDNRMALMRVKNYSPSHTYIESRLPSGISNPYNVAAATIAAGLDGVTNKLELPKEYDREAAVLPKIFAEALDALKDDVNFCEALGAEYAKEFIMFKKETEVDIFPHVLGSDDASFAKERDSYFKFC
ncbi:unnamed protein product [Owenia fusiformis]|uniref:Lengsin n=1 Tax=Owenia fusiformis TaxID=6347 RepID=A0A8S4N2Q4_OWEFU|nr:unnamed protein product [Owenia fusiformis]